MKLWVTVGDFLGPHSSAFVDGKNVVVSSSSSGIAAEPTCTRDALSAREHAKLQTAHMPLPYPPSRTVSRWATSIFIWTADARNAALILAMSLVCSAMLVGQFEVWDNL